MGTECDAAQLCEMQVAIKCINPELAQNAQAVLDFVHEAEVTAKLRGPHVTSCVSLIGPDDGADSYMILLEFCEGGSVEDLLRAGRLEWADIYRGLADAASGFAYLEYIGFVHRDIAARNLLVKQGSLSHTAYSFAPHACQLHYARMHACAHART